MKKKTILTMAVGLVLGLGFAQENMNENPNFGDFDTNADMEVDMTEFSNGMGEYSSWDLDSSGSLNSDEFNQGFWTSLDTNGDGVVSQDEWNNGLAQWGDDSTMAADLDADANSEISEEEFASYDNTAFTNFDTDANGEISETEYQEGVFGLVDTNADDMISEDEFNEAVNLLHSQDTSM